MISFELLQSYSSDELEELKSAANEELYVLQNSTDTKSIDYWSELSSLCKSILSSRNDG